MKKAQTEASFQWVFVLLAGGAFLFIFFFLVRGCAEQGETRLQGFAVQSVAARLESSSWQPDSVANMSVQASDVVCIGGVLTLSNERSSASIERAAVFLPPGIDGELTVMTREFFISQQGSPALALGNTLFVVSENTHYLVVDDTSKSFTIFRDLFEDHPNVDRIALSDLTNSDAVAAHVPDSARTVILLTDASGGYLSNADISGLPDTVRVLGVFVDQKRADFYERDAGALQPSKRLPAEHEILMIGAAIAGDPRLYACARENLVTRTRFLTLLYEEKVHALVGDLPLSSCAIPLEEAGLILSDINDEGEAYLQMLMEQSRSLAQLQSTLLTKSCPVIA